jgi:putative flippase GtrA
LQAFRYVLVGIMGFAVQVASFAIMVHLLAVPYGFAGLLAGLLAMTHNFFWNRHWTFEVADQRAGRQAVSYAAISAVFFAVQLGLLHVLVTVGVPKVLAEIASVIAIVPPNFFAQRRFSFRPAAAA